MTGDITNSKAESCPKCWGRGYYPDPETFGEADQWGIQDYDERYCDCPAGQRRQAKEWPCDNPMNGKE